MRNLQFGGVTVQSLPRPKLSNTGQQAIAFQQRGPVEDLAILKARTSIATCILDF